MALAQPTIQERRPSPGGMSLNLASNNPFRDRAGAASPPIYTAQSPSRLLPPNASSQRPMSTTNPFLDNYQPLIPERATSPPTTSPTKPILGRYDGKKTATATVTENETDLMHDLTVHDKVFPDRALKPHPAQPVQPRNRATSNTVTTAPIGHRRQRSEDEKARIRKDLHNPKADTLDIFGTSPERKVSTRRHVRRNSETSVLDAKFEESKGVTRKPTVTGRDRDGKERSSRSKKPSRRVDTIDKLDVTGMYGVGGMFHHDGPFDACNPHRNRKGGRAAPMQAFAEGSLNNALGGSGPVHKQLDFDTFHGRNTEGFADYNSTQTAQAQRRPVPEVRLETQREGDEPQSSRPYQARQPTNSMLIFDPKRPDMNSYGQETAGLGASTFLEGAPAPRSALVRRESENEAAVKASAAPADAEGPGLQRKKSVVDRFRRGMSQRRVRDPPAARVPREPRNPVESYYGPEGFASQDARFLFENGQAMNSYSQIMEPTGPRIVQSAGGRDKFYDSNPFFDDELSAKAKLPPQPAMVPAEPESEGLSVMRRSRTASNPNRGNGLMRRMTNDNGTSEKENKPAGQSLLTRVKSLRTARRPAPAAASS